MDQLNASIQAQMGKTMAARPEVHKYVLKNARQGDIQSIIDTIDEFSKTQTFLINIGDVKGKILDQALQQRKPKTVLELGTFLGYSGLRIISQLPKDALFVTIEGDSESYNIARSNFEYAGVSDRVKAINGFTHDVIPNLSKDLNIDSFDYIFIDHSNEFYLRDFKMLEDAGLIKSGTMIVADNILMPGAPDYVEYIRNNPNYTTELHERELEIPEEVRHLVKAPENLRDGVEVTIRK